MNTTHFQIEFNNEHIIPSGGPTLVEYIWKNSRFIERINKQDATGRHSGHQTRTTISLALK